jgi:hypothetical protein
MILLWERRDVLILCTASMSLSGFGKISHTFNICVIQNVHVEQSHSGGVKDKRRGRGEMEK